MPMSAAAESQFSEIANIATKSRNRLTDDTIKELSLLKSWGLLANIEERKNQTDRGKRFVPRESESNTSTSSKKRGKQPAKDKEDSDNEAELTEVDTDTQSEHYSIGSTNSANSEDEDNNNSE